jgi:hypothetical protein
MSSTNGMRIERGFLILLLTIAAVSLANGQARPQPTPTPTVWRDTPATPSGVNQRIDDAAIKYQGEPLPRVVLYDIGYPSNDEEFTALDGHAVVLLTALSQTREELPLQRAFVVMEDGKEFPLKQIRLVLSAQSPAQSLAAKLFGSYRGDALYLLPVYLRLKPVDLVVEFGGEAKPRLKVATFGTKVSDAVARLKIIPPTGSGPVDSVLNAYIKREFPGF